MRDELEKLAVSQRLCPACGVAGREPLFTKEEFRFVRCKDCTLIYVENPSLSNIHIQADYHPPKPGEEELDLNERGDKYRRAERILNQIRSSFGTRKDIAILDVGCGNGYFLRFLKDHGYSNLIGIDINSRSVDFVSSLLAIPAQIMSIEDCSFADGRFDFVVMDQILEHVERPIRALLSCRRILKEKGMLWISTPNVRSWHILLRLKQYHRHFTGRVHINHFTPRTLSDILRRCGFKPSCILTRIEEATLARIKGVLFRPEDFDRPFYRAGAFNPDRGKGINDLRRISRLKILARVFFMPFDMILTALTRLLKLAAYIEITARK